MSDNGPLPAFQIRLICIHQYIKMKLNSNCVGANGNKFLQELSFRAYFLAVSWCGFHAIYLLVNVVSLLSQNSNRPIHLSKYQYPPSSIMRFQCAAKHLCGMRPLIMTNPQHHCVNCSDPLHGGLCGLLIADLPADNKIDVASLTDSGRSKFLERNIDTSALICKFCLENLQDAHLKPAASTTVELSSISTVTNLLSKSISNSKY